ncbi:hypothetical protein [Methylomonas sp. AM2-LC]|uniref:hypothetical protein n=1 Tax=Methylomonas sp. AM2-LC TaxID=3153301 RepID=UPI003263537A
MNMLKLFYLSLVLIFIQFPAQAANKYSLEPGDIVLTNCHDIYTKGVIKSKVDDGYTVHFPKDSRPIQCPPFRWHAEFVTPFQSVNEYRLQFLGGLKRELLFKVGEKVTMRFEPDRRVVNSKAVVDIDTEITDISSNGAIAVKLLSTQPDAIATFWQWVGTNYIDLRHKALAQERSKRTQ